MGRLNTYIGNLGGVRPQSSSVAGSQEASAPNTKTAPGYAGGGSACVQCLVHAALQTLLNFKISKSIQISEAL